jgi:HPt (histidine-containing phosphotransfer) domain-containing protein
MEEQAIIDLPTYEQLKELMGSDFIVELVDTYINETGTLMAEISQAYKDGQAVSMGRIAHSIKSSSASLGALVFSQQARELEMMGKANDLAGTEQKIEKLTAEFSLVTQRLKELVNES